MTPKLIDYVQLIHPGSVAIDPFDGRVPGRIAQFPVEQTVMQGELHFVTFQAPEM